MNVEITTRGQVPEAVRERAEAEISALDRYVKGPLMGARVVLTQEQNPRIERPARAEGEVVISGRAVRARVVAGTMDAAVDELAERLGRQLRRFVDRIVTEQRRGPESPPGEWRRGSLPTARPERSWRPPGERRIERRKSFALEPMPAAEAALEMEMLDHDFLLYRDVDTDADAVVYRRDDGMLGVIDPADAPDLGEPHRERSRFSEPVALATAVREMDELDHRFMFFVNEETGRGNVIYLRHDGHYGLIEPAVG